MILTRHVRRRQVAEGAYYSDAFSIRIESDPPLINPTTLAMRTGDAEDFSTFVHEYWHYLQNLTTVAGFSSFELFHDLAARFHETLVDNGDGTSVGSAGTRNARRPVSRARALTGALARFAANQKAPLVRLEPTTRRLTALFARRVGAVGYAYFRRIANPQVL